MRRSIAGSFRVYLYIRVSTRDQAEYGTSLDGQRDCGSKFCDSEDYPSIADLTGEVVYARLQKGDDTIDTAYPPGELDRWAERARIWAAGGAPADLPVLDGTHAPEEKPRDVFVYFIHEGKLRAPAAAMALIEQLR